MGREVRRVPADWQHPKRTKMNWITMREEESFQPMFDSPFAPAMREWFVAFEAWERGERPEWASDVDTNVPYWEWEGGPPDPEYYRPDWPDEIRTHLMMYEDTTEGTPISPAFATPEELARWLADTGASSFGSSTATYEQWLPTCRGAWAPSMIVMDGQIYSGVEANALQPGQEKES